MEIRNPRRILILSAPSTRLTSLLAALTHGPIPAKPAPSADGGPLDHYIHTAYYTASIPIWTETISSPATWSAEWLASADAGAVVRAIGAWIVAFPTPRNAEELDDISVLLRTVADVVEHHGSGAQGGSSPFDSAWAPAPLLLAVALAPVMVPALEVEGRRFEELGAGSGGWEVIDCASRARAGERNEFGERVGWERLREALETGEWEGEGDGERTEFELDEEEEGKEDEETRMKEGLLGSENSVGAGGRGEEAGADEGDPEDHEHVEALQRLMLKMQAVRDMGTSMPEAERRRFAANAVREVMREI